MKEPAVRIESISKFYGELPAVKSLSLDVFPGEVLGFLGPNGAGKTTTIRILCGLLHADDGKVWVNGVRMQPGAAVQQKIGLCPQEVLIWPHLTCREQLQWMGSLYGLGVKAAYQRAEELLELLDLASRRNALAKTLSGGMKRRLSLALALVHDPAILVLDEPEAGLDPQSRVKVRALIRSLAAGKTVILTTHNMDEADRLSDRVAIMDHGELLLVDTPDHLKQMVGEGDVFELSYADPTSAEKAQASLAGVFSGSLQQEGNQVLLRSLNLLAQLSAVLGALAQAGCSPLESRLRQNTLEDVFIRLTGRRLRE